MDMLNHPCFKGGGSGPARLTCVLVDFLLVGQGALPAKFKDAAKRTVEILNLRRLQELLLGHISFRDLKALPTLSSDAFTGPAYRAAGAPPPKQEAKSRAKKARKASVPPNTKSAAAPPATESKADPAKVAVAAPAGSQALVARGPRQEERNVTAVVRKKSRFAIPIPGVNRGGRRGRFGPGQGPDQEYDRNVRG